MYRWTNLGIFYTTYIRVDLAHYEIVHAKVVKGGIKENDNEQRNNRKTTISYYKNKYMYILRKKSLAIYFGGSQFR